MKITIKNNKLYLYDGRVIDIRDENIEIEVEENVQNKCIKYLPIGGIFNLNGIKLKVVEDKEHDCSKCFFDKDTCEYLQLEGNIPRCNGDFRQDKKDVYFKEVNQ